ncbi:flagellar basal-body rod protein FlgB [Rhizobium sp. RU35A]|uniref:Flagellar basal body rod protein FlgB n=1 Tax=Rhizobium straminoryzae TaxID=1387186 RepID=A0A549TIC0_9HYPH|nr:MULTISPECIES: flagellar basal body rod protein FlgB [Rhizobium]TRL42991.1 flagellar basal body rod protein FlgB [Rhizobium straminoryzae]SIQ02735.1 flagellar basal-body rod protein FlgB [Rhizobium sp. RU35A]
MQPIQLFDLASRQAEWLSVRQEVVAGNIANASTPHYKAKDVTPFAAVLNSSGLTMARTQPGHLSGTSVSSRIDVNVEEEQLNNEIGEQESGNTVSLAQELSKTGEIKRQYDLSTNLVKSFHRMMLMTVKR